ncbi:peptidase S1 family protein [Gracilibacillus halophilus YIM-C55.5]|uniref:Peptidase S1 family protein n=1 Tax=Gracilibacillus halophilus YIM-C55.5 TaxID=1308866 RepID=N4WM04_9BACI|nr:S1C family serine protease [Gracilibacillus halophilus]ENH97197.1 peptidase S1 family protein [Gracilibacillus halophilus YIM-C55.5]
MQIRSTRRKILIIMVSVLAITSIIFYVIHSWKHEPLEAENTLVSSIDSQNGDQSLKEIIHQAQKAVVQIEASNEARTKSGAGFVINHRGDIVTNAHVIEDAERVVVKLSNTRTFPAAIINHEMTDDIALIRVPELQNIKPLTYNPDYEAEIGDEILAVGSPIGYQNAVSLGLIVGTERSFSINNYDYEQAYQISADITHGNSGGPLILRETGEVIGINAAGVEDTDIGFSIPMFRVNDQITNWVESAKDKDLSYPNLANQSFDKEAFTENAKYISKYFFESISIRDYINAYTLLGSAKQESMDYTSFRQTFKSIIKITVDRVKLHPIENQEVTVNVQVKATIRDEDYKETEETRKYQLQIAKENGQIKIIDYKKQND